MTSSAMARLRGAPLYAVAADRFRNPESTAQFFSNDMFELHYVSNDLIEMKSQEGEVTRFLGGTAP